MIYKHSVRLIALLGCEILTGQVNIAIMPLAGAGLSLSESDAVTNRLEYKLIEYSHKINEVEYKSATLKQLDLDGAELAYAEEHIPPLGDFKVIERRSLEAILKEQDFQLSGCTDDDCSVQIGMLAGASHVMVGSINRIDNLYTLYIRIIDVESGVVMRAYNYDYRGRLSDFIVENFDEVAANIGIGIQSLRQGSIFDLIGVTNLEEYQSFLREQEREKYLAAQSFSTIIVHNKKRYILSIGDKRYSCYDPKFTEILVDVQDPEIYAILKNISSSQERATTVSAINLLAVPGMFATFLSVTLYWTGEVDADKEGVLIGMGVVGVIALLAANEGRYELGQIQREDWKYFQEAITIYNERYPR